MLRSLRGAAIATGACAAAFLFCLSDFFSCLSTAEKINYLVAEDVLFARTPIALVYF